MLDLDEEHKDVHWHFVDWVKRMDEWTSWAISLQSCACKNGDLMVIKLVNRLAEMGPQLNTGALISQENWRTKWHRVCPKTASAWKRFVQDHI